MHAYYEGLNWEGFAGFPMNRVPWDSLFEHDTSAVQFVFLTD